MSNNHTPVLFVYGYMPTTAHRLDSARVAVVFLDPVNPEDPYLLETPVVTDMSLTEAVGGPVTIPESTPLEDVVSSIVRSWTTKLGYTLHTLAKPLDPHLEATYSTVTNNDVAPTIASQARLEDTAATIMTEWPERMVTDGWEDIGVNPWASNWDGWDGYVGAMAMVEAVRTTHRPLGGVEATGVEVDGHV